jgi:serine/threonine protein kinase
MSERPTKERESNEDGDVPTREVNNLELFYFDEVICGACLGHGSFANVYEVQEFKPLLENDRNFGEDRLDARRYYSEQAKEATSGKCKQYAIKCLRDHFDNPKMFRFAAKDIETEANLLATIDHPHIIKVYAKSASGTEASKCTKEQARDFFIVEDRLTGTLSDKIVHWKREKQRIVTAPLFYRGVHSNVIKKKELLGERLRVAYDVACAIAYLHAKGIVYRDLKADNVGFDVEDKCKLFDFGLARRLPSDPEKKRMNDTYVMSGKTGSLLFMAPEVWQEQPYNEKADVYSFTMLLWNILALELPYLEFIHDHNVFTKQVMLKGRRPTINHQWPKKIQNLLKKAWSKDMDERPTMQQACIILKEVIASGFLPTAGSRPSTMRSSFL